MSGTIPPLPQYAFMAVCLVKSTGTTLHLPLPLTLRMKPDALESASRNLCFRASERNVLNIPDHPSDVLSASSFCWSKPH
jgi:hypothetical protein